MSKEILTYETQQDSTIELSNILSERYTIHTVFIDDTVWYRVRNIFNFLGYSEQTNLKYFKKHIENYSNILRYFSFKNYKQKCYPIYISHEGLLMFLNYTLGMEKKGCCKTKEEIKQNASILLNFITNTKTQIIRTKHIVKEEKKKKIIVIRQLMYYGEEDWVKETLKTSIQDKMECPRGEIRSTIINCYEITSKEG